MLPPGESCAHLEPAVLDLFGASVVLIVLLLAAVLTAQLKRP